MEKSNESLLINKESNNHNKGEIRRFLILFMYAIFG